MWILSEVVWKPCEDFKTILKSIQLPFICRYLSSKSFIWRSPCFSRAIRRFKVPRPSFLLISVRLRLCATFHKPAHSSVFKNLKSCSSFDKYVSYSFLSLARNSIHHPTSKFPANTLTPDTFPFPKYLKLATPTVQIQPIREK